MRTAIIFGAVAVLAGTAACGGDNPQHDADSTTRAVYDVNVDAVTSNFDGSLKPQVTRASVGQLSDKMHALGNYQGLTALSSDPDKGRYNYTARFDNGTMTVEMRIDPDHKIGAFRVTP